MTTYVSAISDKGRFGSTDVESPLSAPSVTPHPPCPATWAARVLGQRPPWREVLVSTGQVGLQSSAAPWHTTAWRSVTVSGNSVVRVMGSRSPVWPVEAV